MRYELSESICRMLRLLLILVLTLYGFCAIAVSLHWGLNICPFHLAKIKPIPVVYGAPTIATTVKAWNGEIILGGCMVQPLSAVCPYCHWPAGFSLFERTDSSSVVEIK